MTQSVQKAHEVSITIIVTVYNKKAYIGKCLESLLLQTDRRFRVIVVDDASSDGCPAAARGMIEHDKRFVFLRQEHAGASAARNRGLALAGTEYVLFLDGDDCLIPSAVAVLNKMIANASPDLIVFGYSHVMPDGRAYEHGSHTRAYPTAAAIKADFVGIWQSGLMYSACNKLFRTRVIKEQQLQFAPLDFGEDFVFCREFLRHCGSLLFLKDVLYRYTFHNDNSMSTVFRANLFQIRCREHMEMHKYFDEMGVTGEQAEEFLARRHAERVIGCIENEMSPHNPAPPGVQYRHVRKMVDHPLTAECIAKDQQSGFKMKLLFLPVRLRLYPVVCAMGKIISVCRYRFPKLFAKLKMC